MPTAFRTVPAQGSTSRAAPPSASKNPLTSAPAGEGRRSAESLEATRFVLFAGKRPRAWVLAVLAVWLVVASDALFHWM